MFLRYFVICIVKSFVGKKILEDYGVNGFVFLIFDSIDFILFFKFNFSLDLDFFIVGLKNLGLAKWLE